jgi:hypothetical protein
LPISNAVYGYYVKGEHAGARLAIHLKEVLHHFELTDGHLLEITMANAISNYSITQELQSTLDYSGILWPAMRNHTACIGQVIQVAFGAL